MTFHKVETDRLVLRVLDKKSTEKVLSFLNENKGDFMKYEPKREALYFTKFYQEQVIQNEYDATMKKGYLRYYIFEKSDTREEHVIGTVSVGMVKSYPYCSGVIGYKIAVKKKNCGYATEVVRAVCEIAYEYIGLHRLEAFVQEDNLPSIRVLEKSGFSCEGKCKKNLKVNGQWKDHLLYAIVKEENEE